MAPNAFSVAAPGSLVRGGVNAWVRERAEPSSRDVQTGFRCAGEFALARLQCLEQLALPRDELFHPGVRRFGLLRWRLKNASRSTNNAKNNAKITRV